MVERFLSQTSFTTQEDFIKNFKINVPAKVQLRDNRRTRCGLPNNPQTCIVYGLIIRVNTGYLNVADMKRYTGHDRLVFQSLGIGHGDMVMLILQMLL